MLCSLVTLLAHKVDVSFGPDASDHKTGTMCCSKQPVWQAQVDDGSCSELGVVLTITRTQ